MFLCIFAVFLSYMQQLLYILPRGLVIGILLSAPMGPIGMLVIQRTLSKGRLPAFFTGLGAAFSDLIYCLLTGFCLSFITDFIDSHQLLIQVVGSAVLAAFGVYLFSNNPTRSLKTALPSDKNYWSDTVSGFLLTFSNPLILFLIIGLFARFNVILPEFEAYHYVWAYMTILAGAMLWWYGITTLVSFLGRRINVRSLKLINRVIALVLIVMAVAGLAMALFDKHLV